MAELSFDGIRTLHRKEKNSSGLTDLDFDFYSQLQALIETSRREYLESLKNASLDDARKFANLKKLIEEIFFIREKKILNKSLSDVRSNEEKLGGLSEEEAAAYKQLFGALKELEKTNKKIFNSDTGEKKPSANIKVRILKEIPSFIGVDMKEYGPFNENQEISLPEKIALMLIERNISQKINE